MTVLVTGGAGYIGSHVTLALRDRAVPVVVLDNLSTGAASLLAAGTELVVGEIADRALLRRVLKQYDVESIVHLAAATSVPESIKLPLTYYANNAANTGTLLELAVQYGVTNFIFSSTAAVYGTPRTRMVDETAPLNPQSPYGASKLMAETMV